MNPIYKVLSEEDRHRVHEESLSILENIGVRIETPVGRKILKDAGAIVDETTKLVKFPKALVESSIKQVTRDFTLGARRPGADLVFKNGILNGGECVLAPDGDGTMILDRETGERRPGMHEDWKAVTRMVDAIDEFGMYWKQIDPNDLDDGVSDFAKYQCDVFRNISKHVQDGTKTAEQAPWFLEIIQAIFGTKDEIREKHPVSYLLCPQSPLIIDKEYTEAYLALKGWDIPVAIMPMPLMGATAPGSLISTIVQGNCEVLSMICLLQANEPGLPIIYAPALAVMNPQNGMLADGRMEYSLMGAAATEMARYYGFPSEGSGGGSDSQKLDIQNGYETGAMKMTSALAWPDIVVGPGMIDGSMVASHDQMYLDVEVFRLAKRAHEGIDTSDKKWLMDVIGKVGPGGSFMSERTTLKSIRNGEWYLPQIGMRTTYENWIAEGSKDVLDEVREKVTQILETHEPLPLGDDVEKELDKICKRANLC